MTHDDMIAILRAIVDRLEDLTLERDALRSILLLAGYQPDDIDQIWGDAKADPAKRKLAHQAYAETRERLEEAARSPLPEVLSTKFPPPGKSN
jgi:hypothetical protein